ncbi:unnamed protein product [marine sediment metagenome]|uniref:Uncharacterized protein n=1 Tax=marine sediment metagenome TaxID=412755 RepID=X0ZZN8_9ZZZZ
MVNPAAGAAMVPGTTLTWGLGSATMWWLANYMDQLIVGAAVDRGRLKIPRYDGADPAAPTDGDIWLRIDL